VAVLEDTVAPAPPPIEEKPGIYLTPEELNHRIATACAEATAELEMKLRKEYEAKLASVRGKIAEALAAFEEERADYYSRVESELVQLALSIAGKILHREAQGDRMLLAALTLVAV
jgi:flagellar assembly protein FliH